MTSHRLKLEISGLPSHTKLDDISKHIRSHCRGLNGSEIQGLCNGRRSLDKVVAVLKFPKPADRIFSLDRLQVAKFRRTRLIFKLSDAHCAIAKPSQVNVVSLVVSKLPQSLNENLIRQHIQVHINGEVLKYYIGKSNQGNRNIICLVQTSTSSKEAVKTLRHAKFQGQFLEVEILHDMKAPMGDQVTGLMEQEPAGALSIFIAKLPTGTKESALKHHIRSHVGGQVTKLECTKSSRGGMKASCQVQTPSEPATAIKRLREARFQGHYLHVQPVKETTNPVQDKQDKQDLSVSLNAVIPDRTIPHSSRVGPISRRFDIMKGISTDFYRWVLSDPGRVYRSDEGDDALEDLYDEYFAETLLRSTCRHQRVGQHHRLDDDSRAWVQEEGASANAPPMPITSVEYDDRLGHDGEGIHQLYESRAFTNRGDSSEPGGNSVASEDLGQATEHDVGSLSVVTFEELGAQSVASEFTLLMCDDSTVVLL
jgi:hypothetical protein